AEAANEAKSRFLAVTTHELRTPLNGVIGMLHLLPRDPLSSKQRDWIRMAHASAETLLRVINDILDFSKVEAGKLELHSEDFDLVESVKSLGALYGERAEAAGLAWSLEIDPSVTRRIRGDRGRVAQVLGNLLNNAIKFTERGAICLDVRQMESGDDVSKVRFEVADTGIGINPAFHAQLFKPFSQVDASMAREHSGTGLGLGICKSLVELMGGRIGFESAAGNGSLFWFEIPFDRAGADQPDIGSVRNGGRHSARIHGRVLIVEDSDTNREVLYEVVSAAGCDCDMVSNGAEAVDAVRKAAYHVVLMDCMMPVLDGFEATRQIRELEAAGALASSGRLPIVAVTANAMKGDRERCLAVGMDDFIAKPFDPERVLRVIREWLERGNAGRVA
ncbi:MAG: response regulator, partial [Candidatus Eisenbacteria bacterium]|nr:response regulator [Candidatus Eisenbacteria bacterium]